MAGFAIPHTTSTPPRSRTTLDKALHSRGEEILNQNRKKWAEEGMMEALPKLSDVTSPAIKGPKAANRNARFPYPKPKDPKPVPDPESVGKT